MTGYMPHRGRFQRQSLPPSEASDLLPEVSASQVRYEEEPPEVSRVLVRVEYADGTAREYEAKEPEVTITEGMGTRRTGLAVGAGDGFAPVSHAVPTLTVRLAAHPRHSLHIRTRGPWKMLGEEAHSALASFLAAMGYE